MEQFTQLVVDVLETIAAVGFTLFLGGLLATPGVMIVGVAWALSGIVWFITELALQEVVKMMGGTVKNPVLEREDYPSLGCRVGTAVGYVIAVLGAFLFPAVIEPLPLLPHYCLSLSSVLPVRWVQQLS